MKIIERSQVLEEDFREILDAEGHHRHPLVDDGKSIRWKGNKMVQEMVEKIGGLNNIIALLHHMGYDKNSEVMRQLYRDLGVSLNLYWEVFYWEVNNPDALDYKMIKSKI